MAWSDVPRSVRLSAVYPEVYASLERPRWNHAHVLKAVYGLMTSVDKISNGIATAAIRTQVPGRGRSWGDAQSFGRKKS